MKVTKEKWIQKECLSIDQYIRNGIHSKRAYQILKALINSSTKKQTRVLENKYGDTISEDTEIAKIWKEYFNELYNYPINSDPNTLIN